MKKVLKIVDSKYSIEYEEGKEYNYNVLRNGEVVNDLKYNIVFDMFQMILQLQEELKKKE